MTQDNTALAPQTTEAAGLYADWHAGHMGGMADFFEFLATPSAERELFLAGRTLQTAVTDTYITENYA